MLGLLLQTPRKILPSLEGTQPVCPQILSYVAASVTLDYQAVCYKGCPHPFATSLAGFVRPSHKARMWCALLFAVPAGTSLYRQHP